jgi:hypothetical protein
MYGVLELLFIQELEYQENKFPAQRRHASYLLQRSSSLLFSDQTNLFFQIKKLGKRKQHQSPLNIFSIFCGRGRLDGGSSLL